MERIEQIKIVKKLVEDSFEENAMYTGIDDMNEENKNHSGHSDQDSTIPHWL